MTLEEFRKKAIKKYNSRKKVLKLNIKDLGEVEFMRPSDERLSDFMSEIDEATELNGKDVESFNSKKLINAAKKLVYDTCPFLHDQELIEAFEVSEPYDIALKIFGTQGVNEIATRIVNEFKGGEIIEDIKN